jgi:hypothetical protein
MLAGLGLVALVACAGEDGRINEPVDPNDLDGDGIPNAADLCPRSAVDEDHDEDGDGVGDACDVCPAISDPLQRDTGEVESLQFEDGVGDACDPRGGASGDIEEAFYAFTEERHLRGTGWTLAGDALHASGDALWFAAGVVGDGLYAQIDVGSVAWHGAGGRIAVGVDGDGAQLGPSCAVHRDRDGDGFDEMELTAYATVESRNLAGVALTGDFTVTMWRAIDRDRVGYLFCRVRIGSREHELLVMSDDTALGHHGFSSTAADASIRSAIVYSFPVNPCADVARCPDDDDGP